MLSALAIALLAQVPCGPSGPILCPTSQFAFFEFAPLSGAGMGTACACTTPTGAKGEAMTFTRASSGTCLKGNTTTGVANGDMVTCSTNQPRVMPGGDGTGALGLLVESARTNSALRSQEFDNASWTKGSFGGPVVPVVTADQAVAPDGTTTADLVVFAATAGAQDSALSQTIITGSQTATVFVKGQSGSGTLDICVYNTPAVCTSCAYVSTSWTRCSVSGAPAATGNTYIGNLSDINGGIARSANSVYLWGAQTEAGAYSTSYIATTSASVTRSVDLAKFAIAPPVATSGSAAGSVIPEWSTSNGPVDSSLFAAYTAGSGQFLFLEKNGGNRIYVYDGTSSTATTGDFTAGTLARLWANWSGATKTINNTTAGTSNSGAFNGAMPAADLGIGTNLGGLFPLDGVAKQICLDPSPSRCR